MTRDQFLAEMMGKCWHEWRKYPFYCYKCKVSSANTVETNFSTNPADILALQQFVMAQEWWGDFTMFAHSRFVPDRKWGIEPSREYADSIKWLFSDPDRFANLVAEFRGWKDE